MSNANGSFEVDFTIIEDASPFFIRYKHDLVDQIIHSCEKNIPREFCFTGFKHHRFSEDIAENILSILPESKLIDFNKERVSLFITEAGKYYGAHKDGYPRTMFSINYPILVGDSECITSWYSDEEIDRFNYVVNRDARVNAGNIYQASNAQSREVQNFVKERHTPNKTMIAKKGEAILFNTDIYHDWDNSKSKNRRVVLTLRHSKPQTASFNDIKKILFGL
jgi:hypothetical protein